MRNLKRQGWYQSIGGFILVLLLILSFVFAERETLQMPDTDHASNVQTQSKEEVIGYEEVEFANSTETEEQEGEEKQKRKSDKVDWDKKKSEGKTDLVQKDRKKDASVLQIKTKHPGEEPEYFTTTIVDQEIVTKEKYRFSITQLNDALTVKQTNVYVNDNWVLFQGSVFLAQETNQIVVEVIYETAEGKEITIQHRYTVYLELEEIVLYCNLEDQMQTDTSRVNFSASASLAGEELPVEVMVNKQTIQGEEGNYVGVLSEGENIVFLQCTRGKLKAEAEYHIFYIKENTQETKELWIDSNLEEQTVYKSSYTFFAKGYEEKQEIPLAVNVNGEKIEEKKDGNYTIQLQEGKNTIVLCTVKGEKKVEKSYTIVYKILAGTGEEKGNNAPELICSLKDGSIVKNRTLNFYVNGKDYKGNWIDATGFTIKCQGKTAKMIYANEDQISYQVKLSEGYNVVVISLCDEEGNTAKKAYSIQYKKQENGVIGTATISVEATTIGCGALIEPTEVDIIEDEPMSYMLCELLEKNGYTYESTGTQSSNFYLARITKDEDFLEPSIPKDLAKKLKEVDRNFPGSYYTDSLGEFDFATGSGWMYQVNGVYPNYSFSDCYLQDGDQVRIRFTLHYGCDIGGGMVKANGGNTEEKGNWEKEW